MIRTNTPHKSLILFIALLFFGILCASLWQRFQHPDLVIRRISDNAPNSRMEDNMGTIGQLMQQVAKNPEDLETVLHLVQSLMAIGQWEGAENFAQKALSLSSGNPSEIRPLYFLSLIHHNRGQHEQAAELLEKILKKTDNPSARYNLGILYIHYLNKPEMGMEQFKEALRQPDLPPGLKAALQEELDKISAALPAKKNSTEEVQEGQAQTGN